MCIKLVESHYCYCDYSDYKTGKAWRGTWPLASEPGFKSHHNLPAMCQYMKSNITKLQSLSFFISKNGIKITTS